MLNVPVFVIYQAGVSGRPYTRGLYSDDTDKIQFAAAVELTGDKGFYPITHSWSSHLGLDFVLKEEYRDTKILEGTISSVMTTAIDGLSHTFGKDARKERSVLDLFTGGRGMTGFPTWFQAFQVLQHLPVCLPTYPLQWQHWQDGTEDLPVNPKWAPDPWIHYYSAKTFLPYDGLARVRETQTRHRKPLFVIPTQDRIFSPDQQQEIAAAAGCKTKEIAAGHGWFAAKRRELDTVLEAIAAHYHESVRMRR